MEENSLSLAQRMVRGVISFYQHTFSPDHGPLRTFYPHGFCRFHPSCSEYTRISVGKYGVIRGLGKGFWRVMRCMPWHPGGVDLP